jgi:hypothetical protein
MTMTNSTVSGNTSNYDGGGLSILGSTYLNNSTITNNTADPLNSSGGDGGGISRRGTLNFRNTIVAGNFAGGGQGHDCSGILTSQDYNLVGKSGFPCIFVVQPNDQVGTIASPLDPKLAPLANIGGSTKTHMLLFNSLAINGGDDATCATSDQRGVTRPIGPHCDIGAYEGTPMGLFLPLILK